MIKAIIFDVDNTILDFLSMKEQCIKATIEALIDYGLNMDLEEGYKKLSKLHWEIGIEDNTWISQFLQKNENKVDNIKLIAGKHAYRKAKLVNLKPYPTVVPTLIKLIKKGIKLAILSDAPNIKALARLEDTNLYHFFDIIIPDANKPNVEGFEKVLKELKVKPSETLMVGDRLCKDYEGAKNANIKFCFAKYGSNEIPPEDCFVLDRFDQILNVIKDIE